MLTRRGRRPEDSAYGRVRGRTLKLNKIPRSPAPNGAGRHPKVLQYY
ncbi:MAG: hypothetical protein J6X86_02755 [Bacteroidales bacterium]|nr:hypothetical protein [Bacteroidales bacterium]